MKILKLIGAGVLAGCLYKITKAKKKNQQPSENDLKKKKKTPE